MRRMSGELWRRRLQEAVKKSGRPLREISLAAGYAHGYLWSILKSGKQPPASKLMKLCEVLGVSVSYVILGTDLTKDQERLLLLYAGLPEDQKKSLLSLVETMARGSDQT